MTIARRPARLSTASKVAALLVAATVGLSGSARGQLAQMAGGGKTSAALQQVPADALVVFKINHLDDVNTKVSTLLQQLGIVDLVPQAKDPLKAFEDATGIPAAALDAKREAVVYMPNMAPKAGGDEDEADEPPTVILLPVADYKALTGALTGGKTEGELTTGRFKDAPDDMYVAHWGDYAAISPRKELLTGKHDGLAPTSAAARELDQKDLCLYVNFPALRKVAQPKLAQAKTKALADADEKMADADAGKKALAKAAVDQAFNVVDSFLRDAEPTTFGIKVDKAGVSANLVVAFTKGSYLGNLFGHMKTTDGPLLGGLPDDKYLFFGGSVADPATTAKLVDDLLAPILPKLDGLGEAGPKVRALVEQYKSAAASTQSASAGLIVPTAAFMQGSLIKYVTVVKADSHKLMEAQEQAPQVQSDLMASLNLPGGGMTKTTVQKNAKTVGGVSFDAVKTEIDPNAKGGQAAQAQQAMRYIYGPDGPVALFGAVDDHTLVSTLGVDDALLATIVEAAKANKDVLSAQVKAVDEALPKSRSAVAYLDLAQFMSTGLSYAHAMNINLGVQLPPNLPPVGLSVGTDPDADALRMDGFVPTSLMQSLVQAGFQIYLSMPHGGGGM